MTYDWEGTLKLTPGTSPWFAEIDRRFLGSAYYARGEDGTPFGRFLVPDRIRAKRVLEVGCGMGTHAAMLADAGANLTAVDITTQGVSTTQRRLRDRGVRADVIQTDAENLTFADDSFDFVWSWGVIHHSAHTELCLREIARVLRPGGRVLVMMYHRSSIVYYLHCGILRGVILGQLLRKSIQQIYRDATDGFYAKVFTKREVRVLLEPHYEQICTCIVGLKAELCPLPRSRLKTMITRHIPDSFASWILRLWGSMIVIEAVKRQSS